MALEAQTDEKAKQMDFLLLNLRSKSKNVHEKTDKMLGEAVETVKKQMKEDQTEWTSGVKLIFEDILAHNEMKPLIKRVRIYLEDISESLTEEEKLRLQTDQGLIQLLNAIRS